MTTIETLSLWVIDKWLEAIDGLIKAYSRQPENEIGFVEGVNGMEYCSLCNVAGYCVYGRKLPSCHKCLWVILEGHSCVDGDFGYSEFSFGERIERLNRWKEILLKEKEKQNE